MNEHTATEIAYKNGYAKGFADGKGEWISVGYQSRRKENDMYKAPIELLSTQMSEHKFDTEKMVIEAVFKTGVNVDKDELIRALQYDRDQYDKGYADAKAEVARDIFEEIEKSVASKIPMKLRPIFKDDMDFDDGFINGKRDALIEVLVLITELKKKYTEGQI